MQREGWASLDRVRREWRRRLAGLDLGNDLEHAPCDDYEDVEWHSLDSYLIGEVWVHVHLFDFGDGPGAERVNLCLAVAERHVGRELVEGVVDPLSPTADGSECGRTGDGGEVSVLVDVGERAEQLKGVAGGSLRRSLVWLRLLDQCPYRLGDPLQHVPGLTTESGSIDSNRELGMVSDPRIASVPPSPPDNMIEGRAEILDRLASEQRPVVAGGVVFSCKPLVRDLLRRTRLTLHAEHISLAVLKGRGFSTKGLDVFYAPRELPLGRTSHGGSDNDRPTLISPNPPRRDWRFDWRNGVDSRYGRSDREGPQVVGDREGALTVLTAQSA